MPAAFRFVALKPAQRTPDRAKQFPKSAVDTRIDWNIKSDSVGKIKQFIRDALGRSSNADSRVGEQLYSVLLAGALAFLICLGSGVLKQWWGEAAPIWLANGVLVAQAMVARPRLRNRVLLGGTLGFLAANLHVGESLYVSASFTGADMFEVYLALLFGPRVTTAAELIQPKNYFRFASACVVAAPLASGLMAMSLLDGWSTVHPFSSLMNWFISDALGMAIFVPAALIFFSGEVRALWTSHNRWRSAALLALLALVTVVVFSQPSYPMMYWVLPPIAWLAFEVELAAVLMGVLVTIAIAIAFTLGQTGPLWLHAWQDMHARIIALQLLMMAALAVAFPISVTQSQRARLLDLLRESEHRYRALAEHSDDLVMEVSLEGAIRYASPGAKTVLGYETGGMLGLSINTFVHPEEQTRLADALSATASHGSEATLNLRARKSDGAYIWTQVRVSALFGISKGAITGLAFTMRDVQKKVMEDQRRMAEQLELERLAFIDGLSGLRNRRYFDLEIARHTEALPSSPSRTVALLLIDIDHFKGFNDLYGHQAGDACLQKIAKTLSGAVRSIDVAARYGGEEFAVILIDSDATEALAVAERIRAHVEALTIPHAGCDAGIVTVSIGVAEARADLHASCDELIAAADAMLYRAKGLGRNQVASAEWTLRQEALLR